MKKRWHLDGSRNHVFGASGGLRPGAKRLHGAWPGRKGGELRSRQSHQLGPLVSMGANRRQKLSNLRRAPRKRKASPKSRQGGTIRSFVLAPTFIQFACLLARLIDGRFNLPPASRILGPARAAPESRRRKAAARRCRHIREEI